MLLFPIPKIETTSDYTKAGYFSNGYQPDNINGNKLTKTGSTIGQSPLAGSVNMNGSSMSNQAIWKTDNGNLYIWVGSDGKITSKSDKMTRYGYYQQVGSKGMLWDNLSPVDFSNEKYVNAFVKSNALMESNQPNIWNKVETGKGTPALDNALNNNNGGGGGGTSAPATSSAPATRDPLIDKLFDRINELEEAMKPKVKTAEEMAEQYDIADKYNVDYWENLYNEATNNYYDSAINEQEKLRTDYAYNNALYTDDIIKDYLKSYQNAAPTAASRGAMAANALSADSLQGAVNSNNDWGMLGSVNQLEQDRKAELARNPSEALSTYQNLGSYLMGLSSDHNQQDVTNYVNELANIATRYAADRTVSQANAQAAASRYSGLAGAAQTNAGTVASGFANNYQQQLYKLYNSYLGRSNTAYLNAFGITNK